MPRTRSEEAIEYILCNKLCPIVFENVKILQAQKAGHSMYVYIPKPVLTREDTGYTTDIVYRAIVRLRTEPKAYVAIILPSWLVVAYEDRLERLRREESGCIRRCINRCEKAGQPRHFCVEFCTDMCEGW